MATKKRKVKVWVRDAGTKWGKTKKWGHGGARPGAGRPKGPNSGVPHTPRPKVTKKTEVMLIYRFSEDLGLKNRKTLQLVKRVIDEAMQPAKDRFGFKVTNWYIAWGEKGAQLTVEGSGAANAEELSRAAQGIGVRVARRTNAALERSGKFFADRYAVRVL